MRTTFILILLTIICNNTFSQNSLLYSPILPEDNIITDAIEHNDTLYMFQVDIGNDYHSTLILADSKNGNIINSYSLGNTSFLACRFIEINGDSIIILGRIKEDTCLSKVVTVRFLLSTNQTDLISEFPFCNGTIQNLRFQNGLGDDRIINGYWVNIGYERFILKMNKEFHLSLVLDSLNSRMCTVDFSRKGYLIMDESFCDFYDKDFNFRKSRYSITEGIYNTHQTHLPYDDSYILESFSGALDFENKGHYVRIIDSSLHVIKQLYIAPGTENFVGGFEPPFFGGVDYLVEDEIWVGGNNNITTDLTKPTHFSISKINDNLEFDCNQYIGFDACYRIYGLRATEDGGVFVYGMKYNGSYDPYLIKLGPNCELPTVSTKYEDAPLISISAYPNPTLNQISFITQGFDPSVLKVEFIDMNGKVLFSEQDLSQEIEVTNLPPNQYFYRISLKDQILGVGSWVKQ